MKIETIIDRAFGYVLKEVEENHKFRWMIYSPNGVPIHSGGRKYIYRIWDRDFNIPF